MGCFRLLGVHFPIKNGDDGFRYIADDARAPGDPKAKTGFPSLPKTMMGAIEERGLLPGQAALATSLPSLIGLKEKSVSSLFNRKPRTKRRDLNAFSMVVVMETTLPFPSTIDTCEVERPFSDESGQSYMHSGASLPGRARFIAVAGLI